MHRFAAPSRKKSPAASHYAVRHITDKSIIKTMKNDVLPVLKKCHGFFDLIPLEVEAEPTKFYVMSFWHEKRDAENFHKDHFPKIRAMYDPFVTAPITVKLCHVDETIPMKLVTAVAA